MTDESERRIEAAREYFRPAGTHWVERDSPNWTLRLAFILGAVILAATAILGCSPERAELVVAGKVYQTDADACERLAVKTGGVCYGD